MKRLTFAPKKGQSPDTIITLPTGEECKFEDGRFTTEDQATAAWLQSFGYTEYKPPRPKTTTAKKKKAASKTAEE